MAVRDDFFEALGPPLGSKWRAYRCVFDGVPVRIIFERSSDDERVIDEAHHRGAPIGGKYSGRLDPPHVPRDQDHLHIFARQKQLFAINKDGSTQHGRRGDRIPNVVINGIRNNWPEFRIPSDGYLESIEPPPGLIEQRLEESE